MEGPISFWGYKEQESNLILPEHDDDDNDDDDVTMHGHMNVKMHICIQNNTTGCYGKEFCYWRKYEIYWNNVLIVGVPLLPV